MENITSTANPKIKLVRSLRTKKFRDEQGLFLTEGIHHVGAAFEAGWEFDSVFYDPDHLSSVYGRDLIDAMLKKQVHCYSVTREVFESIAEKENTIGMVASVHKKITRLKDLKTQKLFAAMVTPQDPGNVGSLMRTLDSIGGGGLLLIDGGVDPFHPTLIRASMGAYFWNPTVSVSFAEMVAWKEEYGYSLIGTSAKGKNMLQYTIQDKKNIVLFGSEQKGLDPNQISACDELISIPMQGHNSSLNISVAAGIILYKIAGLT